MYYRVTTKNVMKQFFSNSLDPSFYDLPREAGGISNKDKEKHSIF